MSLTPTPPILAPQAESASVARLRTVAQDLEASFLAEMLKHSGLGAGGSGLAGGPGEDQFASMLRAEHARALAEGGGIGLAEALFEALVQRRDAAR
jgi:Rod binding domain-containing protein